MSQVESQLGVGMGVCAVLTIMIKRERTAIWRSRLEADVDGWWPPEGHAIRIWSGRKRK